MDKKINIGCNGLIIKDNKLLLGKRKNCYGAGTYGLPGGHLEHGEKLEDAVKRELKEEVGIDAENVYLISIIDQAGRDNHYIQINFAVEEYEGEIKHMEEEWCDGWHWFDLDNLPENIFPPHINIISAFKQKKLYH